MKKPFQVESSKVVYEGFVSLRIDTLKKQDKSSLLYHVLTSGTDAVAIIAIDKKKKYIVNQEYRHPVQQFILGCPGGRIEKGETPLIAAKRELKEETGYTSDQWTCLGCSFPFPAICDQKIYFMLASNVTLESPPKPDPFEKIHTVLYKEKELFEKIIQTEAVDSILCSALFKMKFLNACRKKARDQIRENK